MLSPQFVLPVHDELVIDLFAGGGGASTGIERATGRPVDIAINHDDDAVSMHRMNHPQTRHFTADVFEVCPRDATQGRPAGLLHMSPDCTHFSQARGGQPRNRKIRALAWVGVRWAGQARPRVITLENVKQMTKWGPLVAKRDKATRRVIKLDGSIAAPGERVPLEQQYLIPDRKREGQTWRQFLRILNRLGYRGDTSALVAADYDTPTTRERLFGVFRRDGGEIVSRPPQENYKTPSRGQKPWRPAAEVIDWSIECPSIFTRKRPLADATMRRIARGVVRHVIDAEEPFFITEFANASSARTWSGQEPLRTACAGVKGGHFALVAPVLMQAAHGEGRPGGVKRWGTGVRDVREPVTTVTASGSGGQALIAAFLEQANGGGPNGNPAPARSCRQPVSSITASGSQQRLVTVTMEARRCAGCGTCAPAPGCGDLCRSCWDETDPESRLGLSPEAEAGALRISAFLMRYYGEGGQWGDLREPAATITTKDRLALVTVTIQGTPYVIVDIGLRMLTPRELYRAQGFPDDYVIDRGHDGRTLTKSDQVRMVGNSVPPRVIEALVRANYADKRMRAAA